MDRFLKSPFQLFSDVDELQYDCDALNQILEFFVCMVEDAGNAFNALVSISLTRTSVPTLRTDFVRITHGAGLGQGKKRHRQNRRTEVQFSISVLRFGGFHQVASRIPFAAKQTIAEGSRERE